MIGIGIGVLRSTNHRTTAAAGLHAAAIVPTVENITIRDHLRQSIRQAAIVPGTTVLIQAHSPVVAEVTAIAVVAMDVAVRVPDPLAAAAAAQLADHRGTLLARRLPGGRVRGLAPVAAALRVHLELGRLLGHLEGRKRAKKKIRIKSYGTSAGSGSILRYLPGLCRRARYTFGGQPTYSHI